MNELIIQPWPWYVAGILIGLTVPIIAHTRQQAFWYIIHAKTYLRSLFPRKHKFFQIRLEKRGLEFIFCWWYFVGWIYCNAIFKFTTTYSGESCINR